MTTRLKLRISIILTLLVGLVLTYNVNAYHSISQPLAGVTTAGAMKDVWVASGTSWNAKVQSNTNPAYNIGTIGWTWWTFRDTCDGTIIDNWSKPGAVRYGASSLWDVGVDDRNPCGGSYRGWSMGTHDFKHNGDTWQPYLSTDEGI